MQTIGLQMVAITDHYSGDWIDLMKKAERSLRKNGHIVILPGVEITVAGAHLTMVFPESKGTEHVNHVLSQLDIGPDQRKRKDAHCTKSLEEVAEICHDNDGLLIAAHCLSQETGLMGKGIRGRERLHALEQHVDILEIKPGQPVEHARQRAIALGCGNLPIIVSTDAHCPGELSDTVSSLKMGKPSFAGLQQIKFEPFQRVMHGVVPEPAHPRIIGVQADQGIYPDVPLTFSPHLTTLIGERGSGKSAVLDLIRFTLNIPARIERDEFDFRNRIASFVGNGGTVRLFVADAVGEVFCIERRGDYVSTTGRGKSHNIEFDYSPKVYQLVGTDFIDVGGHPLDHFPVEFFGQGEIIDLSRRAEQQLSLLDEHVKLDDLRSQEQSLLQLVSVNSHSIAAFESSIEGLEQTVNTRPGLRERVDYLGKQLKNPVFDQRMLWDHEREVIEWADEALREIAFAVGNALIEPESAPVASESSPNENLVKDVVANVDALMRDIQQARVAIQRRVLAAQQAHSRYREIWEPREAEFAESLRGADPERWVGPPGSTKGAISH